MANVIYPKFLTALQSGAVNLLTADVRVMLVKTAESYDANDEFVGDFSGANIVQRTLAGMAMKTLTEVAGSSVFDAEDVTFTAVPAGSTCNLVIFVHDGGSDAARRLVAFLDTGTNLPRTTDGDDIPITWSNGADKIWAGT